MVRSARSPSAEIRTRSRRAATSRGAASHDRTAGWVTLRAPLKCYPAFNASGGVPGRNGRSDSSDWAKAWAKRRYGPLDVGKKPGNGASPAGVESETPVLTTRTRVDSRTNELPRVDVSVRSVVDVGPSEVPSEPMRSGKPASVEDALAEALMGAAAAARWDIVAQLGRELEARRLAAASIPSLHERRDKTTG